MRPSLVALVGAALSLVSACGDDGNRTNEADGETTTDSGTDDTAATDEGTSAATGTGTTGDPGLCGNGELDSDEQCDDGNLEGGDGCQADCSYTSGTDLWTVTFDGPANGVDYGNDVAVAPDGAIFVVGSVLTEDRGSDVFIARLDPDGTEVWTTTYDGAMGLFDSGNDIAVGPDGGVVAVGSETITRRSGNDADRVEIWVGSFDADGNQRWVATFGGLAQQYDVARGVAVDDMGRVYVAGRIEDVVDNTDFFVQALDPQGAGVWSDRVDRDDGDTAAIASLTSDGHVIVAGSSTLDGDVVGSWIRKYDRDGGVIWTKGEPAGADPILINGGDLAADDSIAVVGPGRGPSGLFEAGIRRLDSSAELSWTTYYDKGSSFINAVDVLVDSDDAVFVVGAVGLQDRSDDGWLGKFSAEGERVWVKFHNGPASLGDGFDGVAETPDGFLIVAGAESVLGEGSNILVRKYVR